MNADLWPILEKLDKALLAIKWARRKREIAALERKFEPEVAAMFVAQGAAFVGALDKAGSLPSTWNDATWLPALGNAQQQTMAGFITMWREVAGNALLAGAELTAEELGVKLVQEAQPIEGALGIKFGLRNPRAVDYLLRVGADLVAGIDETTKLAIRRIVVQAASEGWSYDRTAKAIIEQFAEFAEGRPQEHIESRAHGIAVTEIGNAYTAGNYAVGEELRDAGLTMQKAWSTMGDEKLCDLCQGNEAEGWIPFDDPFFSGDARPLAHPYCRCDILMKAVH